MDFSEQGLLKWRPAQRRGPEPELPRLPPANYLAQTNKLKERRILFVDLVICKTFCEEEEAVDLGDGSGKRLRTVQFANFVLTAVCDGHEDRPNKFRDFWIYFDCSSCTLGSLERTSTSWTSKPKAKGVTVMLGQG